LVCDGRPLEALAALDEALEFAQRTGVCWFTAELYRRRGELLVLMRRTKGDLGQAEQELQKAVVVGAVPLGRSRSDGRGCHPEPYIASFRKPKHQVVYERYSSPQSPISVIRSRDFASTASIMLRSSASSLTPNTRALSVRCCATPSRAPTITPATAGRSSM
jgi:hypothetical protein